MTNDNGLPKVQGVGRVADNDRALLVMLDRRPTDDELRIMHMLLLRIRVEAPTDRFIAALMGVPKMKRENTIVCGEAIEAGDVVEISDGIARKVREVWQGWSAINIAIAYTRRALILWPLMSAYERAELKRVVPIWLAESRTCRRPALP